MTNQEVPVGSAIITPNQMFEQILDVGKKVDHLVSSFDPWQQEMRNAVAQNASRIDVITAERTAADEALNIRVRSLENWRWFLAGLGAIAGPGAAVVAQLILR